jgi:hypothetical protein
MKNDTEKIFELLSAYADGELSPEDAKELEKKISYTPGLQKKLAEILQLKKLAKASVKQVDESPYFETRLMANLEEKPFRIQLRKWSPVAAVIILTIAVMILLKYNPGIIDEMVEEQKTNLAGFYKENLQPLLFASDLTNEDIFNFAFYNQLPLDNTKTQFLQIGSDASGNEFFEITTASIVDKPDNFGYFVKLLNLDEEQQKQIDSLMHSYAEDIQTQVLVNDKNTIAINPNLWNFRKAIVADVMKFASLTAGASVNAVKDVMPFVFSVAPPEVDKMVNVVKSAKDNEYIFFTPDTFFVDKYEFDKDAFKKEMQKVKEEMQKIKGDKEVVKEELKKSLKEMELNQKQFNFNVRFDSTLVKLQRVPGTRNNIHIYIDSNLCRVRLDKIEIPDIELPDMDSLEALINEATKQIQSFSFTIPDFEKKIEKKLEKFKYDVKVFPSDSVDYFKLDIQIPNVDSLQKLELQPFENWVSPFTPDSVSNWFKFFYDDSISSDPKKLELRMFEFEKEMKKFKEEMERMKKELRKDSVQVRQKKPVEI